MTIAKKICLLDQVTYPRNLIVDYIKWARDFGRGLVGAIFVFGMAFLCGLNVYCSIWSNKREVPMAFYSLHY